MEKKFINPTKANLTLSIVIPQIRQLLKEASNRVLAAVSRMGATDAANAFTSVEMQTHMAARLQEQDSAEDEKVANEFRVKVTYILDNPTNPNVQRAVAAAGGNLKDFLLQLTQKIIEVERAS